MHRIVEAKPLPHYLLWLRFQDGVEGEVNLANLVGKGVFALWNDPEQFSRVSIDADTHTVVWPGGIDLCPDRLYQDLAGSGQG
jgi:hypothetical protein